MNRDAGGGDAARVFFCFGVGVRLVGASRDVAELRAWLDRRARQAAPLRPDGWADRLIADRSSEDWEEICGQLGVFAEFGFGD